MKHADLIVSSQTILPIVPSGKVLEKSAIVIRDGIIVALGDANELNNEWDCEFSQSLGNQVIMPGLVNAHTHAAMNLLRGYADDLPLQQWLEEKVWPAERDCLSHEFVRCGTELAVVEMALGGTTCFGDMYFFPDATASVVDRLGLRACIGIVILKFPTAWAETQAEYFSKGLEIRDRWRGHQRIQFSLAPHAPYTIDDEGLERVKMLADELDIPITMHIHEASFEINDAIKEHGGRPLQRLLGLGLLNSNLSAVHMTQITDDELQLCKDHGIHIIHCPESNLKLASGFCPVDKFIRLNVNVALGTDGAASNNDLDMWSELRTAALLAKGVSQDPTAVPAITALEMATINGAKALGLADTIGSLEIGKSADMISLDLGAIESQPIYDLHSHLVYNAHRNQVCHVWVAGNQIVKDRQMATIDLQNLHSEVQRWRSKLSGSH